MNIKTCVVWLGLLLVAAGCGDTGRSSSSAELEAALAKAQADKAIAEADLAKA